jgi:UDP-N-acetylmuramoylalanine-D-glutamate ligase
MEPIIKYAKRITLYGDAGKAMFSDLLTLGIPIEYKEAFDDAFNLAEEMSEPGDTVLLSPMATGYGEFKSYRERAERFCYLVGRVAEKYKKTK